MSAELDGSVVLSGSLSLPRRGVWTAELELDRATAPSGAVRLAIGRDDGAAPDIFRGTVVHAVEHAGRSRVQVAAGVAALWSRMLDPRQFVGAPTVTLDELLQDLARDTGEVFATPPVHQLERWSRARGVGAAALGQLTREVGLDWRLRPDGTVEVLEETWPATTERYEILEHDGLARVLEVAPVGARLLPGQIAQGKQIERVVYTLGGSLRAALHYAEARGSEAFRRAVESVLRSPVWDQTHGATVVVQHADGTVDVLVDDERIVQLTNVPVRLGGPTLRAVLQAGDRVQVSFDDGNPRRPVVSGVDLDPSAGRGVARLDDTVDVGTLMLNVVSGVLSGTYTPPGGPAVTVNPGTPFPLVGRVSSASSRLLLT